MEEIKIVFTEIITMIRESIAAITLGFTALGIWWKFKKDKDASTEMLYTELEKLKQKVIIQVGKDVENAISLSQKDKIIEGLKDHCTDCYDSYMEKHK
jgi:hypothetical protein